MSRLVEALDKAAESPRALKKARLHICTWHALCLVIKTIVDDHKPAYTILREVADWCRRQRELTVTEIADGWWKITEREGESDVL